MTTYNQFIITWRKLGNFDEFNSSFSPPFWIFHFTKTCKLENFCWFLWCQSCLIFFVSNNTTSFGLDIAQLTVTDPTTAEWISQINIGKHHLMQICRPWWEWVAVFIWNNVANYGGGRLWTAHQAYKLVLSVCRKTVKCLVFLYKKDKY